MFFREVRILENRPNLFKIRIRDADGGQFEREDSRVHSADDCDDVLISECAEVKPCEQCVHSAQCFMWYVRARLRFVKVGGSILDRDGVYFEISFKVTVSRLARRKYSGFCSKYRKKYKREIMASCGPICTKLSQRCYTVPANSYKLIFETFVSKLKRTLQLHRSSIGYT